MSKIDEVMDLEDVITPQILEQLSEQEILKPEEQQSIQQLCLQKIAALHDEHTERENYVQTNMATNETNWRTQNEKGTIKQCNPVPDNSLTKAKKNRKRKMRGWLTAVAISALFFALSTTAIGTLTTDTRLLQLFQADSQSQIAQLNEMSYQIEQAVTNKDYTVTMQESISDQYNTWILLEVTGPEDVKLNAEQLYFRQTNVQLEKMTGFGYVLFTLPDADPDDNRVSFVLDLSTQGKITGQQITLSLEDLGWENYELNQEDSTSGTNSQWESIANGQWQFIFELPQNETTVSMWQWKMLKSDEKRFLLHKIEVSPLSVTLHTDRLQWDAYVKLKEEPMWVFLKDGTMLELSCGGSGGGGLYMQYSYKFESPADLKQIDHIIYCGKSLNW